MFSGRWCSQMEIPNDHRGNRYKNDAARRLMEGAPIAESTEMFEIDQGTKGAKITALFSISRASALEDFSVCSQRLLVNMMASV